MHRRPSAAFALALALAGAVLGPIGAPGLAGPVRAATPPKVVVVVGPTHSLTSSNLQWGEAIAQDAASHGAQVIRVFYPDATWSAVAAAAAGANLLIYLGHGNGYPSPYTSSLMPDRQDGMGLDPVAGAAEDQVQYYGEQYMATLHLAPDALVILNHLCYASGNSEPGLPQPTQAVAIQRVDNFAAGFIAGGAAAVMALGTQDAGGIVDALYGPSQTLDQLFMATGGIGVAQFTVPSVRTPGARLHLDPDSATSGFYRSLAGNLDLASSAVLSGGSAAATPVTGAAPGAVPTPAPSPTTVAPAVLAPIVAPTPTPQLAALSAPSVFTPNGDGISDVLPVTYAMSAPGTLEVSVVTVPGTGNPLGAGAVVRHLVLAAMPSAGRFTWDGTADNGSPVPDGDYDLTVAPIGPTGTSGPAMTVRTRVLTAIKSPAASPSVFYPLDGDGVADVTALSFTLTQPATVTWTVTNTAGRVVRTLWPARPVQPGTWTEPWDGTAGPAGTRLPAGEYRSVIAATTAAGTIVMRAAVWLAPFRVTASPSSGVPGQTVGVNIAAAEPLRAAPRVVVRQPGLAAYVVATRATGGLGYRAVFRLRAGTTGTVTVQVLGVDRAGNVLSSVTRVGLR